MAATAEKVGFGMMTDLMIFFLLFHAMLYFLFAGGKSAFFNTCGKSSRKVITPSKWDFIANDNDFLKYRSDQIIDLEKNRPDSSGELSTTSERQTGISVRFKKSMLNSPFMMKEMSSGDMTMKRKSRHQKRLLSDIDGSPSPGRWSRLNSRNGSPLRAGSSFELA